MILPSQSKTRRVRYLIFCFACALPLLAVSCKKSGAEGPSTATVAQPKEAAVHLEQAFASAQPEVKQTATVASQALRTADYEKAIQSLHTIKAGKNLTLEQGMAVHASMVAMETKLLYAMEAGDANAKRAYELLRKLSRD